MQLLAGNLYRTDLRLLNARGLGPSWLVAAFSTAKPGAEVADAEISSDDRASVLLHWRADTPGSLEIGETISAPAQGGAPGQLVPKAVVLSVRAAGTSAFSLEQALGPVGKLVASGLLVGVTWWLTERIKRGNTTGRRPS